MSEDQFTKLFVYMEKRFDNVDKRFEAVDKRFDDLTNLIEAMLVKLTLTPKK